MLVNGLRFIFLGTLLLVSTKAFSQTTEPLNTSSSIERQINDIAIACASVQRRDRICEALVELRQIGNDAVEIVKAYADLSPEQYAFLTAANMIAQRRLRFRNPSIFWDHGTDTLDIKERSVSYTFELSF